MSKFQWTSMCNLSERMIADVKKNPDERDGMKEAKLRLAISNAFIAVHNQGRQYLEETGEYSLKAMRESGNRHTYIWHCFWRTEDPIRNQIAKDLRRLQNERYMADHESRSGLNLSQLMLLAEESVITCRRVETYLGWLRSRDEKEGVQLHEADLDSNIYDEDDDDDF
jgi:hypothetical protein